MDQQKKQEKPLFERNQTKQPTQPNQPFVSLLPLGGIEDVTKNLYVYEYGDEILIVDCGIGFADESMLGVDLLLPDVTYLQQTNKKIVGMVLSHGHEDHIGAVPFILPQLKQQFPVFASPFTAALTNEKLQSYEMNPVVRGVQFDGGDLQLGSFTVSFIRITHSVPDTANIFIKTPVGNFYHGSDFKFDMTPADGKRTDFAKMMKLADEGVLALMSDCLGAERPGNTPSEQSIEGQFEQEMRDCKGKFIITTYSSNVARLNQAVQAAKRLGRKVCFVGRSLIKVVGVAQRMGLMQLEDGIEVKIEELSNYTDNQLVLVVAGSQGQENSALTRIANGEHREIKLEPNDMVVFSSDAIPGNEISVSELIDTISKRGATALYAPGTGRFHVSGHGSINDLLLMISLTRPKFLAPISGNYKHMHAYKQLAQKMGYKGSDVMLMENGREVIFTKDTMKLGRKIDVNNVYVDQLSGEEVESFVLRDREKLAKEGIIIVMAEIHATNGQLANDVELVARGFPSPDVQPLAKALTKMLRETLGQKKERISNWMHVRKMVGELATKHIQKKLRRHPLVLPVVIEV